MLCSTSNIVSFYNCFNEIRNASGVNTYDECLTRCPKFNVNHLHVNMEPSFRHCRCKLRELQIQHLETLKSYNSQGNLHNNQDVMMQSHKPHNLTIIHYYKVVIGCIFHSHLLTLSTETIGIAKSSLYCMSVVCKNMTKPLNNCNFYSSISNQGYVYFPLICSSPACCLACPPAFSSHD